MVVIYVEKVEILLFELICLKVLFDFIREKEIIFNKEIVLKLGVEIVVLKREFENVRSFEEELEMVKEEL